MRVKFSKQRARDGYFYRRSTSGVDFCATCIHMRFRMPWVKQPHTGAAYIQKYRGGDMRERYLCHASRSILKRHLHGPINLGKGRSRLFLSAQISLNNAASQVVNVDCTYPPDTRPLIFNHSWQMGRAKYLPQYVWNSPTSVFASALQKYYGVYAPLIFSRKTCRELQTQLS